MTTIPTQGRAVTGPETLSSLRPVQWMFLVVLYHWVSARRSFRESLPEKLIHPLKSRSQ